MNYKEVLHKIRKTGQVSHEDFKAIETHIIYTEEKLKKSKELLSRHIYYWEMLRKVENDPNPIKALAYVIKQMDLVKHEKEILEILEENKISNQNYN